MAIGAGDIKQLAAKVELADFVRDNYYLLLCLIKYAEELDHEIVEYSQETLMVTRIEFTDLIKAYDGN